ncbi:MAG: hypothetical protein IPM54_18195 [Polyangiaceae bacterium]|nr:hypothetical protein [Polyangiaceae bacterium]
MTTRQFRSSFFLFSLLGIAGCGGTTTTPVVNPAAPAKPRAEQAPSNKADMVVAAPVAQPEPALPTKVTSLFQFIGADTPVIVNVPRLDKVVAALDAETREAITKELLDKIGKESRFEAAVAKSLIESFDGAVIFADPKKKDAGAKKAAEDAACLAARFRDPRPVELALSAKAVERDGARFTITNEKDADNPPAHGVWLADSGVLLGCATREALAQSLSVATGALPSYTSSRRYVAERANDVFVSVDMHPILGDSVEKGSDLFASLTTPGQSLGLDLRLNLYGSSYPPVGSVIAPASQDVIGQMPKGTIGALGVSLKRAAGKDLVSIITMYDKALDTNKLRVAKEGAAELGLDLADIDGALGDDFAVGVYRDPKKKFDFDKSDGLAHMAVVFAIATKDEAAHKKIWNVVTTMVKKKPKEASVRGNVIESVENPQKKKKEFVRIESRKGVVVIGTGDKAIVKEALAKFGKAKETLASTAAFADARAKEKPATHVLGYLDGATLQALVEAKGDKTSAGALGPAFLSLTLGPTDRGLELALGGGGAMGLIGTGAALAVSGMKSYLAKSKAAEAKSTLYFMASSARRAYHEGKGTPNNLCKSSVPVPATIPKGTTHTPTMGAGSDWDSGDATTGWKCLGYFTTETLRYQYQYIQGSGYKGPKRGGPDPGKDGFEVSAEGDLDGDGKTSLFTKTGKIVNGELVLDDDVFSSDPTE